ncbi:hypothetical protein IPC539_06150 [Pseudomonas aeruginosa]|nr:hypothetical protein BKN47_11500 [Pseudomonas aeruginosa]RMK82238.1 hypothetical protein IPC85_07990 [Pseudomonas aeruginosa]RMK89334.1 hypothetical protein IPC84_03000 [Pseudomonas aeruginosa]RPZ93398.1 hypothetical protein IPC539_06150 [Pseudomonas aeruginosa]
MRFFARKVVNGGPVSLGGLEEHTRTGVNELSDFSRNFVPKHPDLFILISAEVSYGVRQKPVHNIHQPPERWIRAGLSIFDGLFDLHKAAMITTSVDPPQIKIVLSLRTNRGIRPMAIEMVEQQIQDNRGLIVETADCANPT